MVILLSHVWRCSVHYLFNYSHSRSNRGAVRLWIDYSSSGIPAITPSLSFRNSWPYCRNDGHKTRKPEIYSSWFNNPRTWYRCTLSFHSTSAEVALLLILFAVGGAFMTLSANVIIYFTPPDSTAVVATTYSTMRIIGGAIGPVIAGLFLGLYTSEVTTSEGVISSVPNTTAFNAIFLVGSITSLSLVALMLIMKRRAISMGMPAHSSKR